MKVAGGKAGTKVRAMTTLAEARFTGEALARPFSRQSRAFTPLDDSPTHQLDWDASVLDPIR